VPNASILLNVGHENHRPARLQKRAKSEFRVVEWRWEVESSVAMAAVGAGDDVFQSELARSASSTKVAYLLSARCRQENNSILVRRKDGR